MSMHGRPTAAELVDAVAGFLESDVRQATDGQVNFHARVATNVLRIVERELSRDGDPKAALAELGFADEAQLAAAIRDGDLDDRADEVTAFLRRLVQHRLAVAHPGYAMTAVADRLFSAIENGHVDAVADMWAEEITVWQLGDGKTRNKTRALRVIDRFVAITRDRHYDVLSRAPFGSGLAEGFVQQHVLHGTARDGTPYRMRVAIIVWIGADGLITRVDEYFDPAALEPLNKQEIKEGT
jgi:ketosteroid isomerase-like protein